VSKSKASRKSNVLAFPRRLGHNSRMAPDDVLGKSFTFRDRSQPGWVVARTVEVVAYDPERGWKLWGQGFDSPWIPFDLWQQLLEEGVLVAQ
jgi:hypothetical protein